MGLNVSPNFNLTGWDWKTWLKGNKEAVKIIVSLAFGYAVTNGLLEAGLVAIVSKAILDIVDFYASKVELS